MLGGRGLWNSLRIHPQRSARVQSSAEFSNLHGASLDGTALIQKKLSGRWADAESYQVNVPQLGTLELCCDMRASNCQLQVMRSHLTSWGLGSAQTMSITHPPIFWLGVDYYCLPAPLHCNLGIVTNGMDALESLLVKFDRQLCTEGPIPEALEERRQRWNNAALQVAQCKQEAELKLLIREVQELQNRIDEAKRKIDDLNVDSDQSSGDEGDADDVGLAWLERRRRQNQRSRRQRSERRAARFALQVGELEEAMGRARCAFLEAEGELKLATQLHDTSYEALESASGIHMVRWKTVCKQFRVNKGAYLGHGYTGDICKKISTLEVCVPLTNCLLEEFRPQLQVLKRFAKVCKGFKSGPMCTDCWQVLLISETHPGSLTFLSFGVPPSVVFLPLPFLKPPPPPSSTLL